MDAPYVLGLNYEQLTALFCTKTTSILRRDALLSVCNIFIVVPCPPIASKIAWKMVKSYLNGGKYSRFSTSFSREYFVDVR